MSNGEIHGGLRPKQINTCAPLMVKASSQESHFQSRPRAGHRPRINIPHLHVQPLPEKAILLPKVNLEHITVCYPTSADRIRRHNFSAEEFSFSPYYRHVREGNQSSRDEPRMEHYDLNLSDLSFAKQLRKWIYFSLHNIGICVKCGRFSVFSDSLILIPELLRICITTWELMMESRSSISIGAAVLEIENRLGKSSCKCVQYNTHEHEKEMGSETATSSLVRLRHRISDNQTTHLFITFVPVIGLIFRYWSCISRVLVKEKLPSKRSRGSPRRQSEIIGITRNPLSRSFWNIGRNHDINHPLDQFMRIEVLAYRLKNALSNPIGGYPTVATTNRSRPRLRQSKRAVRDTRDQILTARRASLKLKDMIALCERREIIRQRIFEIDTRVDTRCVHKASSIVSDSPSETTPKRAIHSQSKTPADAQQRDTPETGGRRNANIPIDARYIAPWVRNVELSVPFSGDPRSLFYSSWDPSISLEGEGVSLFRVIGSKSIITDTVHQQRSIFPDNSEDPFSQNSSPNHASKTREDYAIIFRQGYRNTRIDIVNQPFRSFIGTPHLDELYETVKAQNILMRNPVSLTQGEPKTLTTM